MRLVAAAFVLLAGCAEGQRCFDNAPCEVGLRCDLEQNICVACSADEIPYNGIDDDCDARSDDRDVDGDGDDAIQYRQGGDCDDADPTVSSLLAEVCSDRRDNDCDGEIDEVDCGDRVAPSVRFVSPKGGDGLYGAGVPIVVASEDDVGVTHIRLFANQIQIGSVQVDPRPSRTTTFRIDARTLSEGAMNLRVEVLDVAGRYGTDQVQIQIDNNSTPQASFVTPELINAYAGNVAVLVDAQDFAGVASVELLLNGRSQGVVDELPFGWIIDSLPLDEGVNNLEAKVTDVTGLFASSSHTFNIDRTPPTVVVRSPIAGTVVRGTFDVQVEAADASGISEISVDERWVVGGSQVVQVDSTRWDNGVYILQVKARDRVIRNGALDQGNEASASLMVLVDNPADPLVTVLAPAPATEAFHEIQVEAEVRSPLGVEIAYVEVWIDGTRRARVSKTPYVAQVPLLQASGTTAVEVRATDVDGREGRTSQTIDVVPAPGWRLPQRSRSGYVLHPGVIASTGGQQSLLLPGRPSRMWQADTSGVFVNTLSCVDADVVYAGDVDADGFTDLVFTSGGDLELWRGRADGSYIVSPQPRLPASVDFWSFGDFDADGDLDLYFSTALGQWTARWAGQRWGQLLRLSFQPSTAAGVVDYNLDGRQDLVVANAQGAVEVWSLDGVWQRRGGLVLQSPVHALAVADNQNLLIAQSQRLTRLRLSFGAALGFEILAERDIGAVARSLHSVSAGASPQWWVHDGTQLRALDSETLTPLAAWAVPGRGVLVADFDGDQLLDAGAIDGDELLLAQGRALGSLNAPEWLRVDGRPHAVTTDPSSAGRIAVLSQAGTPKLRVFDPVGDWNFDLGDGFASDLVWTNAGLVAANGQRMFWVSDRASIEPLVDSVADLITANDASLAFGMRSRAPPDIASWTSAADINPVRRPLFFIEQADDFEWSATAGLCVMSATEPALWCQVDTAAPNMTLLPSGSRNVAFFNYDNDQFDDVVVAHAVGVSVYRGAAGGGFVFESAVLMPAAVDAVAASDLNGDGLSDLLVTSNGRLWVIAGRSLGAWFNPISYALGGFIDGAGVFDLDLNGAQDLLAWGQEQAVLRTTAR